MTISKQATTKQTSRRRMMAATMLAAAAVAGVGALGTAAPANAGPTKSAPKYLAISYSTATGHVGTGQATNLDAAVAGSLSKCGGHCAVMTWSKNGCVALAVSGQYHYGWYGSNIRDAQQGAMQRTGPGSYVAWSGCVK